MIRSFRSWKPCRGVSTPNHLGERATFELLVQGRSNAEIAEELVVGASTVKTHVAHALTKLGLRDRVAAVIFAYEHGLAVPGGTDDHDT